MEENKIGKIDEYYTGDLSIIDIWALTAQVSEELSPVPRPGPCRNSREVGKPRAEAGPGACAGGQGGPGGKEADRYFAGQA